MTTPLWTLLAFAGWTLVTLLVGVGVRRWAKILGSGAKLTEFPADQPHGSEGYRAAMRAHANCVENLPVYGAIVLVASIAGIDDMTMDRLALVFIGARVMQTLVHMLFTQTNAMIAVRFGFFFTQIACMFWMGIHIAVRA